jgi:hypothetical protein
MFAIEKAKKLAQPGKKTFPQNKYKWRGYWHLKHQKRIICGTKKGLQGP